MHVTIGLVPQKPVCRYHGNTLIGHVEPAPMEDYTGQLRVKPTRVVYRCKCKDCHVVAVGEHSRPDLYVHRRRGKATDGLSTL